MIEPEPIRFSRRRVLLALAVSSAAFLAACGDKGIGKINKNVDVDADTADNNPVPTATAELPKTPDFPRVSRPEELRLIVYTAVRYYMPISDEQIDLIVRGQAREKVDLTFTTTMDPDMLNAIGSLESGIRSYSNPRAVQAAFGSISQCAQLIAKKSCNQPSKESEVAWLAIREFVRTDSKNYDGKPPFERETDSYKNIYSRYFVVPANCSLASYAVASN